MNSNEKNQFVFKFKRSDFLGSIIMSIILIGFSVYMLIWANFNTQLYAHIFQLIFLNFIFVMMLVIMISSFNSILITEVAVSLDEIIQKSFYKKTIKIKWQDVKKVKFSYGNRYIYIISNESKICINIRINDIEFLVKYIRTHLDDSLTKKAFYNLEASTFVSLK